MAFPFPATNGLQLSLQGFQTDEKHLIDRFVERSMTQLLDLSNQGTTTTIGIGFLTKPFAITLDTAGTGKVRAILKMLCQVSGWKTITGATDLIYCNC